MDSELHTKHIGVLSISRQISCGHAICRAGLYIPVHTSEQGYVIGLSVNVYIYNVCKICICNRLARHAISRKKGCEIVHG